MFRQSHAVTAQAVPSVTTATFTLGHLAATGYDGPIKFDPFDNDNLYVVGAQDLDRLLAADLDKVPSVRPLRANHSNWNGWKDALGVGEDELGAAFINGRAIMEQIAEWFVPVRLAVYHPTNYDVGSSLVFGLPHLMVEVQVFTGDVYEGAQPEGIPGPRLVKKVTA